MQKTHMPDFLTGRRVKKQGQLGSDIFTQYELPKTIAPKWFYPCTFCTIEATKQVCCYLLDKIIKIRDEGTASPKMKTCSS